MTRSLRALFFLVAEIFLLCAIVVGLAVYLSQRQKGPPVPSDEQKVAIAYQPTSFAALKGWADDPLDGALEAFARTCAPVVARAEDADFLNSPFGKTSHKLADGRYAEGTNGDWLPACREGLKALETKENPRDFFERTFTPVAILAAGDRQGLFTGYYEPELTGAREPGGPSWVPLLERPGDLVSVDLGAFREELKGKRIAGRVVEGALRPFEARAEIEEGALGDSAKPLVWIDDPVDAFFLHIQGSGRVRLDSGEVMRVGYAGQNGHPYLAIGKVLIETGEIAREEISMQTIRAWLMTHPEEGRTLMRQNASYIFFQDLGIMDPALGPLGAGGINLMPERSLAVDRTYHALGVPVWLETSLPPVAEEENEAESMPYNRLLVAQDTGGAILGPVRGDIFFGSGPRATTLAGHMKEPGTLTVLLPHEVANRLGTDE